jgi:hypothetical protein
MTKAIIKHQFEEHSIAQRSGDGYVNLTELCKAGGKKVHDYMRLTSTQQLLSALAADAGITITDNHAGSGSLVETLQGIGIAQGTWAHPEVAIDCAQWVSMKLRIWANRTLMKIFSNQPIEAPPEDLWVPEIEVPQSSPHDVLFEELAARVARMNQNPDLEQRMQAIESQMFRLQQAPPIENPKQEVKVKNPLLHAGIAHPNPELKEIPTRTKIRKLITDYCHVHNQNYRNVYQHLYEQYKLREGYNVYACCAKMEVDGEIDKFHQMVTALTA